MNLKLKLAIVATGRPAWIVAREAGLSRTQLSHIVTGVRPARTDERARLAKVLDKAESDLFTVEPALRAA